LDTIKQIINRFRLTSKKSLGQNYILDQNITNKITKLIEIKNELVLEIGPGPGCLTRSLLDKGAKKIIAVEKDQRCINALEYQKKYFLKKLIIVKGDCLKKDVFNKIKKEIIKYKQKVIVVSNLPYNSAIPILSLLLKNRKFFSKLLLMFQEEQANRIIAKKKTKNYGRISILGQWLCKIEKKIKLSPNCFFPRPKINSTILFFNFKKKIKKLSNENMFYEIIKKSFNQRRKTMKNCLKFENIDIEKILIKNNIRPNLRPEELDYNDFANLSNSISNLKKNKLFF
tara:strand:- start:871 stop:1725 length:855 start_codon:yes stop_codon:yes gene_type:complete